eukprot:SAG31_NODE_34847_length_328_cov_1.349345_1_plen_22_part_01
MEVLLALLAGWAVRQGTKRVMF